MFATDYYWRTDITGNWEDGNNWSTSSPSGGAAGSYPDDASDVAYINASSFNTASNTITLTGNVTCGTISFSGLDVATTLDMGSNNFYLNGSFILDADLTINNEGTCEFQGAVSANFNAAGKTLASVTLNKTSSTDQVATTGNVTITSATFTSGKFFITGETVDFDGDITLGANTEIEISSGTLNIGNDAGTDLTISGGMFDIDGGTITVHEDVTISGGELEISSGTISMGDDAGSSEVLTLSGGTLDQDGGTINLRDRFTMTSGTLEFGGGTMNVGNNSGLASTMFNIQGGTYNLTGGNIYIKDCNAQYAVRIVTATEGTVSGSTIHIQATTGKAQMHLASKAIYDLNINSTQTTEFTDAVTFPIDGDLMITAGTVNILGSADVDVTGLLDINAGTLDMDAGTLDAAGNLDMDGGAITQDGGTITIASDIDQDGGTVTINSGTFNVTGDADVAAGIINGDGGNLNINDNDGGTTLTIQGTGELEMDGGTVTIGDGTTENIVISGTGTLDINTGTLNIKDYLSMTSGTFDIAGGTVNISQAGAASSNDKLDFSGGTYNLTGGDIYIKDPDGAVGKGIDLGASVTQGTVSGGTVHIESSSGENASIQCNGKALYNFTVNNGSGSANIDSYALNLEGSLTLTGGTLAMNANILLKGTWTKNGGTFTPNSYEVEFNGTAAQSINGSDVTTFHDLEVDNTGDELTLNKATIVSGTLTMTNGNVNTTSSNSLTINDTDDPGISGGSANSLIDGPVIKTYTSTTAITFPVGDGTTYRPVILTPSTTTSETWTIEYFPTKHSDNANICGADNLVRASYQEYWDIGRAGSVNAKVRLYWGIASDVHEGHTSSLRIGHYTGGCWTEATASVTTSAFGDFIETDAAMTSFSPFTFGSTDHYHLLPVELISFEGKYDEQKGAVGLFWSTASESNNDYFAIERSLDGKRFEPIAHVDGAGDSQEAMDYQYWDEEVHGGGVYYRLRQVDYNGDENVLPIVHVTSPFRHEVVDIFPIPSVESFTIHGFESGKVSYQVFDISGQKYMEGKYEAYGNEYFDVSVDDLPAGNYYVKIVSSGKTYNKRLVVKD